MRKLWNITLIKTNAFTFATFHGYCPAIDDHVGRNFLFQVTLGKRRNFAQKRGKVVRDNTFVHNYFHQKINLLNLIHQGSTLKDLSEL